MWFNIRKPLLLIALSAILLILLFKACDKKQIKSITSTNLTKDEQVAIIVDPTKDSVTTVRRNRKDKKETTIVQKPVDGARDIRIGVSPEGRVIVTARTKGFIHEPGFVGGWGKGLRLGGDVQLGFYSNWGVNAGITTTMKYNIKPFVAISYTLSRIELSNTSILLGIDLQKQVLVGIRFKL